MSEMFHTGCVPFKSRFMGWYLIYNPEMWVFLSQQRHERKRFFDVQSGQKYGPSGSSGPTKMNIKPGRAVLRAAQTVTVLPLHRCEPPLLCYLGYLLFKKMTESKVWAERQLWPYQNKYKSW
jgi:hypothetical protein